jgi:hypothetical protein
MCKTLFLASCVLLAICGNANAQKNEISLIIGGGVLTDGKQSTNASAFTVSYDRQIVKGFAVEGSLDVFYIKNGSLNRDDFGAAQIAVVYHFGPLKNRRVIPYVTAGIGRITTDFTEISSDVVYRIGGGIKYYFGKDSPFGLRVEVRDEITPQGHQAYPLPGDPVSLVSIRAGVTYRF